MRSVAYAPAQVKPPTLRRRLDQHGLPAVGRANSPSGMCSDAQPPRGIARVTPCRGPARDEEELPPTVVLSIEADLAPLEDPDEAKSTRIAAAIGEGSQFDRTFGYHADGVDVTNAIAPDGWRDRLVIRDTPATTPGRGLCLEPHDCVVSKLYVGREKDLEFADVLIAAGWAATAGVRALMARGSRREGAGGCPARRGSRGRRRRGRGAWHSTRHRGQSQAAARALACDTNLSVRNSEASG